MSSADLILIFLCVAIVIRLVTFNRTKERAQFKRRYSVLAWLMTMAFGSIAISVLSRDVCVSGPALLLIPPVFIVCLFVFYERGNVASLVRLIRGEKV
jgi:hypothetical protein